MYSISSYSKAENVYILFYLDNVTKLTADGTSPDVVAGYMPRGFCNIDPEVYEAFKYAHEKVSQRILGKKLPLDAGITYSSSIDQLQRSFC